MKRADDFAERRKHIANLTDQELYDRFWALIRAGGCPAAGAGPQEYHPLGRACRAAADGHLLSGNPEDCGGLYGHSLMSHGAGHVVYKLSREKNLSIPEAGHLLAQGKYWDEAAALFKEGK